VVQVTAELQWLIGVQVTGSTQVSWTPFWRSYPASQALHCESVAVVQETAETQWSIAAHGTHES